MSEWTSILKKLPSDDKMVITYSTDYDTVEVMLYKNSEFNDVLSEIDTSVTHWMPLPEAPQ